MAHNKDRTGLDMNITLPAQELPYMDTDGTEATTESLMIYHLEEDISATITMTKTSSPFSKSQESIVDRGYLPVVDRCYPAVVDRGNSPVLARGYSPVVDRDYSPDVDRCYLPVVDRCYPAVVDRGHPAVVDRGHPPVVDRGSPPVVDRGNSPVVDRGYSPVVDRGYSWVVMVAVFCAFMFNATLSSVLTLVYQVYILRYQLNATSAGWLVSLPDSLNFLSSPLVGLLFHKFPVRNIAMLGAAMQSFGLLVVAFASEIWVLYLTSILMGVGNNMFFMAIFIIIPQYFLNKRGIAMGFGVYGYDIGAMLTAPVVTWSLEFFGITQTLIFMSGALLQIVVATALFKPQPHCKLTETTDTEDGNAESSSKSRWQVIKDKCGLGLITKPVLICLMITIASLHCVLVAGAVFISGLAKERTNLTAAELATMLSISAVLGFVRIPSGFCFDHPQIRPYRMYLFCVLNILTAVLLFITSFTTSPISIITWFALYSMLAAATYTQHSNMLTDLVRAQDIPSVIALNRTFIGISLFIAPVIVGRIKDLLGSFQLGFILLTINHIIIVLSYMLVYAFWRRSVRCIYIFKELLSLALM